MATSIGGRADVPLSQARDEAWVDDACPDPRGREPAAGIVRAPYLQQVDAHGGRVLWTARSRAPYTLELTRPDGRRDQYTSQVEPTRELQGAVQHSVQVTNLTPDTVYCYALRGADGVSVPTGSLHTAPRAGTGTPLTFVAFGDSGEGGADQAAVVEQLQRVHSDLILVTGDVAYPEGSLDSYERNYFDMYAPMLASVPVFPIAGNHDYITREAAPFREVFALPENGGPDAQERWYSFDWGDVHFVALDTERVGAAQTQWLEADLSKNTLPWTVVMLHKSPYGSGEHGSDGDARAAFSPIFEAHHVQLVLAGHDHNYERTEAMGGVTYVVTGGGGRGTRPVGSSSFTAFAEDVLHFLYVTVDRQDLRLYAIDATGQEFDFLHLEADTHS